MFIETKVYYHRDGEKVHSGTMNILVDSTKIISLSLGETKEGKKFYSLKLPQLEAHLPLAEGRRIWKKLKSLK